MIDVERFVEHVNSPKPEGHSFTVGDVEMVIDIRPTWHYHEHVHERGFASHEHVDPEEFGKPDE